MSGTDEKSRAGENAELDHRTARLREHLSARPSLLDSFASAPAPLPVSADAKLRSVIRTGHILSFLAAACGLMVGIFQILAPSRDGSFGLVIAILVGSVGVNAFTAISLLRARMTALEGELEKLRREREVTSPNASLRQTNVA
ncbi:hypothetical protein ACXR0O_23445 [Verrucomicrobiota bacterium sgz303538]